MAEHRPGRFAQDYRFHWGLTAAAFFVVILMSGLVVWIVTALFGYHRGRISDFLPRRPTAVGTAQLPANFIVTDTATATIEASQTPVPVEATWTPLPTSQAYVRWLYWYVRPSQITQGECVQITWETENAVRLQLFRDKELILDNAPSAKTFEDCPTKTGYTIYRMEGVNSAGESNWIQLQVRVNAP